ncbi:PHA-granule associated protein 4 [Ralstonia nicotianae]|uniref:PHA-granule associated protein 4 n=1 Tax=Ralstonia pseudosolanacearum TaxID=1310165 RepID=UPI002002B41B|nr:PHA-granule associated protein 4 [Ralstonia pseudosolanacearum]MCK4118446.1 PHA-granule associated protein 4 [Ralstonia pseudosolanacearum]
MVTARAGTREEALRLLHVGGVAVVDLDYETGWRDAVELGRVGQKAGIRVTFRSQENIAVRSLAALDAGLSRPKQTFRQRNLYCQFNLDAVPPDLLAQLEAKAAVLGDYVLACHLTQDVDASWDR